MTFSIRVETKESLCIWDTYAAKKNIQSLSIAVSPFKFLRPRRISFLLDIFIGSNKEEKLYISWKLYKNKEN